MIPDQQSNGNLQSGIHMASWQEFTNRFGYNDYRKTLLKGLKKALTNLREAGCLDVYINGSFITSKELPKDFDGCWNWGGVDEDKIDNVLLEFANERATQKKKYGGELFPNFIEGASQISFLEYFQRDKYTKEPKGIIQIDLRTVS